MSRGEILKYLLKTTLLLVVGLMVMGMSARAQHGPDMRLLARELAAQGVPAREARSLLKDPRAEVDPLIVVKNLFFSSPKADGKKRPDTMHIDDKYIGKGRAFMREREATLADIRSRYAVGPEVITAILIVETKLGTYKERYQVFPSYLSLAACLDPDYFNDIRKEYGEQYPRLMEPEAKARAERKARWAVGELAELIVIADDLGRDPLEIKGSFAGAMGPGQFIPSSFAAYGVDGDQDKRRDPFDMDDAVASIANYLHRFGWSEDAPLEKRRRAVWAYNHADVYVNTIMMLVDELGG